MKRIGCCVLLLALATFLAPTNAVAKGPSSAYVEGPGLSGRISLGGDEGSGPLGEVVQAAGFFPGTFGQRPDPMLAEQPDSDLGPRYTATYSVPGPSGGTVAMIRQDLYPYANPSPVSYLSSGQPFFESEETRGGWFVASSSLKDTLVEAGLPASAPVAGDNGGLPGMPVGVVVGLIGAAALLVLATRRLRRRSHAATADI